MICTMQSLKFDAVKTLELGYHSQKAEKIEAVNYPQARQQNSQTELDTQVWTVLNLLN